MPRRKPVVLKLPVPSCLAFPSVSFHTAEQLPHPLQGLCIIDPFPVSRYHELLIDQVRDIAA